jgi:hypothetical protein
MHFILKATERKYHTRRSQGCDEPKVWELCPALYKLVQLPGPAYEHNQIGLPSYWGLANLREHVLCFVLQHIMHMGSPFVFSRPRVILQQSYCSRQTPQATGPVLIPLAWSAP